MGSREDPVDRGRRRAGHAIRTITAELRDARIGAGLSQSEVANAVGISRSQLSRIETHALPDLSIGLASRIAAAVGLDLSVRLYPGRSRVRDLAQLRMLDRLRARLGPGWRWDLEVPLPVAGDQRAWDAVATHVETGLVIWVEAESRLNDVQAVLRRVALKQRDGSAGRMVLAVNDTRLNRDAVKAAGSSIHSVFPADMRRALMLLARGADPKADVLVLL